MKKTKKTKQNKKKKQKKTTTTGRVLNNQQLKYHTQVKNRESFNFVFPIFSMVQKRTFPGFSPGGFKLTRTLFGLFITSYASFRTSSKLGRKIDSPIYQNTVISQNGFSSRCNLS